MFWRSKANKKSSDSVIESLIGNNLHEFLNDQNCWEKIIEISYKVWEKEMPDAVV